jgi:hypothetical protein
VADFGTAVAEEHADYLNGAKDVIIGHMFQYYRGFNDRAKSAYVATIEVARA